VISTLANRLTAEFPDLHSDIIERYVKIRTLIRIQHFNDKIREKKFKQRNARKAKQFVRAQQVNLSESESDQLSD